MKWIRLFDLVTKMNAGDSKSHIIETDVVEAGPNEDSITPENDLLKYFRSAVEPLVSMQRHFLRWYPKVPLMWHFNICYSDLKYCGPTIKGGCKSSGYPKVTMR